jgi:hypothetical protein
MMRRRSGRRGRGILTSFWTGLTIVVVTWWLLLGGALVWVLPERVATAAPTFPVAVAVGMIVRVSQPSGLPLSLTRDRTNFETMRQAVASKDEDAALRGFATFEWIDVEDGQIARVLVVDRDAVQIELLEGKYAGESAWILRSVLRPK